MSGPGGYVPPRRAAPQPGHLPLEVDLVYGVTACGTCTFFWPDDPARQPYGPFPAFDLPFAQPPAGTAEPSGGTAEPSGGTAEPSGSTAPWTRATTAPPGFPNGEVLDGCRKAPVMTIGINPNLTAFAPGPDGASWTYPGFRSDGTGDLYAKYAYYYRYRSVSQERLALDAAERYLLDEPRVVAPRAGAVVSATRTSDAPSYEVRVRYDGDQADTVIPLDRGLGTPRWVLLVSPYAPHNRFGEGDVIAGRLHVPAGEPVELLRQTEGYYERFVPVLEAFQTMLRGDGHPGATLRMGEDVCQLDMVGCASPHWNPAYLGGTEASEREIVDNCVRLNAWALKQLVQTRPAVLYLVGESSYRMFAGTLGALVERDPPLPAHPEDGAFTLLRATTDPQHPAYLRFSHTVDGLSYDLRTRLVVAPHFSYASNFVPQFRMPQEQWQAFGAANPKCVRFLETDPRLRYTPPEQDYGVAAVLVERDLDGVRRDLEDRFPAAAAQLTAALYEPDEMMLGVLADAYQRGDLRYGPSPGSGGEVLARTEGSCRFCVNDRWSFPQGCPYGKVDEPPPPPGALEAVARAMLDAGDPGSKTSAGTAGHASPGGGR